MTVHNGDLGVVSRLSTDEGELVVDFDGRQVTYAFGEFDELVVAYATTIHKGQGSEYPAVVIPLTTQHYRMLQRNLVYTGVTRGKRLVVLIGQRKGLAIAVKGARARKRWSEPAGVAHPSSTTSAKRDTQFVLGLPFPVNKVGCGPQSKPRRSLQASFTYVTDAAQTEPLPALPSSASLLRDPGKHLPGMKRWRSGCEQMKNCGSTGSSCCGDSRPMPLAHLERLNPEQRRAVEHGVEPGATPGGPLLVIAGAGSGKTNTLAHRVAHLIVSGADPRRLLLMTFSRRAASEMTKRVERIARKVIGRQRRDHDRRADLGRHLPWHRRPAAARVRRADRPGSRPSRSTTARTPPT